jgi:hypothetical protein
LENKKGEDRMTRKALLIGKVESKRYGDLPGVSVDLVNFRNYLLSDFGGAWEEDEIITVNDPSLLEIEFAKERSSKSNFAFIAFFGHGHHLIDKYKDETIIIINDKEELPVSSLNPGCPRVLIVIDACRKIEYFDEEKISAKASLKMAETRLRYRYREIYDQALSETERGCITIYSCNLDEAAGEDRRMGGLFSSSLIICGDTWHQSTSYGNESIYTVRDAFNCASRRTNQIMPQQNPQMDAGRRLYYFPFAVKP